MPTPIGAHPGILHRYLPFPALTAFEHAPSTSTSTTSTPLHTLIFIGGLFDGPVTVPYTPALAQSLPPSWRLVQPLLSSSYTQWGTSTLDKDVTEISACVAYFRNLRSGSDKKEGKEGKVVLMGHSTGSQDVIHYLVSSSSSSSEGGATEENKKRSPIDGSIMQASASDREALIALMGSESYEKVVNAAQEYVTSGKIDDILPVTTTSVAFPNVPITARRWLSLASPAPDHNGQDDYFSSDLSDTRLLQTFGKVGKRSGGGGARVMFLYGGRDQYVPGFVDRRGLVSRWEGFVREGGGVVDEASGVLEGADHALQDVALEVVEELCRRVGGFLGRVEGGCDVFRR